MQTSHVTTDAVHSFALHDRSVLKIVPEDTGSDLAISVSCLKDSGNAGAGNAILATRSRLISARGLGRSYASIYSLLLAGQLLN